MHLLARWAARQHATPPVILTVDHGLAAGSADRAATVLDAAQALGLTAYCLTWQGEKPEGDIEAAARQARYRLMGDWCQAHHLSALYLAHTEDDQAETFLLRLARGSGLDGLSAMQMIAPWPVPGYAKLNLIRPLLQTGRAFLRQWLRAQNITWFEDPMNADSRFARVRLRQAWAALEQAGLDKPRIAAAARHLGRARQALDLQVEHYLARHSRTDGQSIILDGSALQNAPREIALRLVAELLRRISAAPYRPRFDSLSSLLDDLLSAAPLRGRTLQGCRIGKAPKGKAFFGPHSLAFSPEPARKNKS